MSDEQRGYNSAKNNNTFFVRVPNNMTHLFQSMIIAKSI